MKKFKPQSPNPSIKKPTDASLAVIGQLNELVEGKVDVENIKTTGYDIFPFIITPTVTKLQDNVKITNGDPAFVYHKYKLSGILFVDSGTNYFNQYIGTFESISAGECDVFYVSKLNITVTAYDNNYQIVTPFAVGATMNDPDTSGFPSLTQADTEVDSYLDQYGNQFYNYYNIVLHGYAEGANTLSGDINFEIEILYGSYCDSNPQFTYYYD